jgi:hypothetical protein
LKSNCYVNPRETFKDRVESQDELHFLLEKCFGNEEEINLNKFTFIVENVCSEIFLYILIFLLESRPFNKTTLENYEIARSKIPQEHKSPILTSSKKMVASPNLLSKFSPSVTLSRSPCMKARRYSSFTYLGDMNILNLLGSNTDEQRKTILMKLAGKADPHLGESKNGTSNTSTEEVITHVRRKDRKALNQLSVDFQKNEKKYDEDLPILPATKYKVDHNKINPVEVEKISKE